MGHLTTSVKDALIQKHHNCVIRDHAYVTTYLVSYRAEASRLNHLLLDSLNSGQQIEHQAIDYEENWLLQNHTSHLAFSRATNLPDTVTIKIGAKVMYLTNMLLSEDICNDSCGIITAVESSEYPTVAFPTSNGIKVSNLPHFHYVLPFMLLLLILDSR